VYVRQVNEQTLTFVVSGRLWRENLVMVDRQTRSWWAQATGTSIDGKFKGTTLKMFPNFSMMTWKEWVADHPNTLVLSKRTRRGLEGIAMGYTDYHRSSRIGVTGQLRFNDKQLPAKARVLGFRIDDHPYAVDLAALTRKGSITTMIPSGKEVKIVGTRDGIGGSVFVASDGSKQEQMPSSVSYWFAWKAFFPATELIRP
jgi:hypothetical protein